MERLFMRLNRGFIKTTQSLKIFGIWFSTKINFYSNESVFRYTSRDKEVYSIALQWPQNNQLLLGALHSRTVNSIQLLGVKGNLVFKTSGTGTLIEFPQLDPDSAIRLAYVLKITTKWTKSSSEIWNWFWISYNF